VCVEGVRPLALSDSAETEHSFVIPLGGVGFIRFLLRVFEVVRADLQRGAGAERG